MFFYHKFFNLKYHITISMPYNNFNFNLMIYINIYSLIHSQFIVPNFFFIFKAICSNVPGLSLQESQLIPSALRKNKHIVKNPLEIQLLPSSSALWLKYLVANRSNLSRKRWALFIIIIHFLLVKIVINTNTNLIRIRI